VIFFSFFQAIKIYAPMGIGRTLGNRVFTGDWLFGGYRREIDFNGDVQSYMECLPLSFLKLGHYVAMSFGMRSDFVGWWHWSYGLEAIEKALLDRATQRLEAFEGLTIIGCQRETWRAEFCYGPRALADIGFLLDSQGVIAVRTVIIVLSGDWRVLMCRETARAFHSLFINN